MKITYILLTIAFILSFMTACSPKQGMSQNNKKTMENNLTDTSGFISADKAVELALAEAGLSSKDVRISRTDFDYDNGIWHYEVEFRQGNTEYDINVKADDGAILSFEKDFED